MSARLRDVEDMLARLHVASAAAKERGRAAAAATGIAAVRLEASTYAAKFYLGSEPIRITGLPLRRGPTRRAARRARDAGPDLEIPEPEPFRLSRRHFAVVEDGACWCRDLNSELGTIVNDVPLGRDFGQDGDRATPRRQPGGRRVAPVRPSSSP